MEAYKWTRHNGDTLPLCLLPYSPSTVPHGYCLARTLCPPTTISSRLPTTANGSCSCMYSHVCVDGREEVNIGKHTCRTRVIFYCNQGLTTNHSRKYNPYITIFPVLFPPSLHPPYASPHPSNPSPSPLAPSPPPIHLDLPHIHLGIEVSHCLIIGGELVDLDSIAAKLFHDLKREGGRRRGWKNMWQGEPAHILNHACTILGLTGKSSYDYCTHSGLELRQLGAGDRVCLANHWDDVHLQVCVCMRR